MSDTKSSVRNEQINNVNGIIDNSGSAKHLSAENTEADEVENSTLTDGEIISPASQDITEHTDEESKEEEQVVSPENGLLQPEMPNLAVLDKLGLIRYLTELLNSKPVESIINEVENIKINYYKKHKAEIEKKRKAFIEQGGDLEDFKVEDDPYEKDIKDLLQKFRELKYDYNKVQDDAKQKNLDEKYKIIEEIKELVKNKESINRTFQEFRELQKRWRSIGPVPQQNVKDLWETYHHHVEAFYDYIRINQELRDLDLKKNLESKIVLCEKAEELLLEPNPVNAFRSLQDYHNQWREIGPVPQESKNEIWERFREATSQINKRHHEYFETQKDEQRKNLEAKIQYVRRLKR